MKWGNGASTWAYLLRELDSERTRLIMRWRMRWKPTFKMPALILIRLLLAPIEFVMERKMNRIIQKERGQSQEEPIGGEMGFLPTGDQDPLFRVPTPWHC